LSKSSQQKKKKTATESTDVMKSKRIAEISSGWPAV